ncbi:glycosyltransferase family 4 protein [Thermodesulfobacteriota bacterium]
MRILHIIYDDIKNPWCGGGGAYRVLKVNEYLAMENRIVVLTGNYPGAKNEKISNIKFIRIGLKSSYLLSRISFTLLIPFYLHKIKSDTIVNEFSFFSPCFADIYSRKPVVNVIHHLMGKHSFKLYPVFGLFPFINEKVFLLSAKNIITSTKAIRDYLKNRYPCKNVKNIFNSVSNNLFRLKSTESDFILFLGRIDIYMKGLDILIEAFSQIDSQVIKLKIAGSGKSNDIKRLKQLVNNYGLGDRVAILGRVTESAKFELLRTCLFLVMPSRFEGWGITAVEANAARKPVIGTKIKGLSEAVVNHETAILVEPENVEQLVSSIVELISDKEKRISMGKQGREWARRFSWEAISSDQYKFYQSVLGGKQD